MKIMGFDVTKAKKEDSKAKDLIKDLDEVLEKYRQGKTTLEARLIENEEWYKSQHWQYIRNKKLINEPEPVTAYLFNTLFNKHADFMDNFAYPNFLPQDGNDEQEAQALSKVIPTILDRDFKPTYSKNMWEKLKHGTAVYGIVWDSDLDHGVGDVSITDVDLMNCYWLEGINNIQDSPRFYVATPVSNDILKLEYPDIELKKNGDTVHNNQYKSSENKDLSNTSTLVDVYIRERVDVPVDAPMVDPMTEPMEEPETESKIILRFVKYVGSNLLYDSFNDPEHPEYEFKGYYFDNKYPFEFDVLFNEKNTPVGFGLLDILKSPQIYIDKLDQIILRNAAQAGRIKHLVNKGLAMDLDALTDTSVDVVEYEGTLNEDNYKQYQSKSLAAFIFNHRKTKIDELKDIGTTMDFNRGNGGSGVTAASAIALLQEAGNKTSRDMLDMSYESLKNIYSVCIERVRQFYTVSKTIRLDINLPGQPYQFIDYSNKGLQDKQIQGEDGQIFTRRPYFDIKVVPEKKSPYSQIAHNEMAKELFQVGFFSPQMAPAALVALEMMKFEGKEKVRDQVKQNDQFFKEFQQMQQAIQGMQQENVKMRAIIQERTGTNMGVNMDQFKGGQQ